MKKSAILSAVLVGIFSFVLVASSADYTPLAPLPGTFTEATGKTEIGTYLSGMLKLLIALGGATAILMAIIGGTQYVASGIAPSAKQDAKNRITSAFIGLALVLTSYLILNSINPKLVAFNFMLPAIGTAPGGSTQGNTSTGVVTNTLSNGATNSAIQSVAQSSSNIQSSVSSQSSPTSVVLEQPSVDSSNDYSIITHCLIVPTYNLCPRADLNNDGKTDSADLMLFAGRGGRLDLNSDKTLELDARQTPVSCFFKKNTISLSSILPRVQDYGYYNDNWSNVRWMAPNRCVFGSGGIHPPVDSCNGSTWLKWSVLGSACAGDMSFGFDPLGVGNYTKFQGWVIGATSGNRINLSSLFVRIFYDTAMDAGWANDGVTGFKETTLADVSYSTVAQYDLNNDGIADLNETGADMVAFTACKGHPALGSCAQADFNNDGTVDASDIVLRDLMMRDLFSQPTDVLMGESTVNTTTGGIVAALHGQSFSFAPYRWLINWFESMLFSVSKYTDRQIVQYCVGHKPFEKCGTADMDDSCLAQYRACGTVMACRAQAESCKVEAGDITKFDTLATPLDINRDGKVNLR